MCGFVPTLQQGAVDCFRWRKSLSFDLGQIHSIHLIVYILLKLSRGFYLFIRDYPVMT